MNVGGFYFLIEKYFVDFPDPKLMRNREVIDGIVHNRPCFYAFQESNSEIYWMIPFSSKLEKYKEVYRKNMVKYGRCDTIVFGEVLGGEKAFLIQNMCPAILEYIGNEYVDRESKSGFVEIPPPLQNELIQKGKSVLILVRRGKTLVFPDILKIEKELKSKFK